MTRTALDPVCEMEIRPEDAAEVVTFEGHRVYLCSEDCYEAFLDLPHSFVGWTGNPGRRRWRRRLRLDLRHVVGRGRPAR